MSDGVVIYQSEGSRMVDQWFWNGGYTAAAVVATVFLVVVVGCVAYTEWRKPKWQRTKWW